MSRAPVPRRRGRTPLLLSFVMIGVVLAGTLLGGCARVRTALAVQPDDTVTGEVILATPPTGASDTGPAVRLPGDLAAAVSVARYAQDGYTGSVLRFSHLGFAQVDELATALAPAGGHLRFAMRRAGGRLLVTGAADLTTVPLDRADIQLKISFPGRVVETDGDLDGSTVSWTFAPGEVGNIDATVAAADPHAPSVLQWALGLAALVALAAVAVVVLARGTRNPPLSRPRR